MGIEPACKHYEECGGCIAQHLSSDEYVSWKLSLVSSILKKNGIDNYPLEELEICPKGSRRRARFAVGVANSDGVPSKIIGFRRRSSSDLVDIKCCPVLLPELESFLPRLRYLLQSLSVNISMVSISKAYTGIDIIFHGLDVSPPLDACEQLASFAQKYGVSRLSVEIDPNRKRNRRKAQKHGVQKRRGGAFFQTIVEFGQITANFSGIIVRLPCGAFLQPTSSGESFIVKSVCQGLDLIDDEHKRIADLYSGVGSISFPIAKGGHSIWMYEGVAEMCNAARECAQDYGLPVSISQRDLARQPLGVSELNKYDAVIFDPPRAGAAYQARLLSISEVERVVAVSCNPLTFSRDARILLRGRYKLINLKVIDQFLWSNHVELIGIFKRIR